MSTSILQHHYGLTSERPVIALAPMAGVTDVPFRRVCKGLGADYSVTEMAASAPQLLDSKKNQPRLEFPANTHVKILQIIGNDATQMAHAAKLYAEMGADIIDINLGCPAKKISKKGAGSALLADLPLVEQILKQVTTACPVPVTVKTRLGTDHDNYTLFEVAQMVSDAGIKLLTVHGRTRSDKFNGHAQFDEIARIKQAFPQLIVIANGDIDSVKRADQVLQYTQCDGLMIGRGAVGNPWLFSDLRSKYDSEFHADSVDKMTVILNHIAATHRFYGDIKGVRFARKHIQAYLEHLRLAEQFTTLAKLNEATQQLTQLETILSSNYTRIKP